MFLGAVRRPDKATAYKKLKNHLIIMGSCVVFIRITPYVLHYVSKDKEILHLHHL